MKYRFWLVGAVAAAMLFGPTVQATEMLPEYRRVGYAAYGNIVGFFNDAGVFMYDLSTKQTKQIWTNPDAWIGESGITVLKDGIYWVDNFVNPSLRKYSFTTQSVTEVAKFGSFGTMEKNCAIANFKMLSDHQVVYVTAMPSTIGKYDGQGVECGNSLVRYYDLNTKQLYADSPIRYMNANNQQVSEGGLLKDILQLPGDSGKVTSANLLASYYMSGLVDPSHVWVEYHGYAPGSTLASADAAVQYNRLFNVTTGQVIETPLAKTNSESPRYLHLSVPLINESAQGRMIVPKEPETGGSRFVVFNVKTNSIEKELDTKFVSHYYTYTGPVSVLLNNHLSILAQNTAKNEAYYYDVVSNTECAISGQKYKTVVDTLNASDNGPTARTMYLGRWLKFSALNKTVVDVPLCGNSGTPASQINSNNQNTAPAAQGKYLTGQVVQQTGTKKWWVMLSDTARIAVSDPAILPAWYSKTPSVKVVSMATLKKSKEIGTLTARPGTLVKFQNKPAVYFVSEGRTLRPIVNGVVAVEVFGADWTKKITTLNPNQRNSYKIIENVTAVNQIDINLAQSWPARLQ